MSTFRYALVITVMWAIPIGGCISGGTGRSNLIFSPDGKHICYIQENRIEENIVDGKTWSRSISIHWCDINAKMAESSTYIDTLGWKYKSHIHVGSEAQWSPDSSRIGVRVPSKLNIVDITSGNKTDISDGNITSFAWLSDGQLAYLTCRYETNLRRLIVCRMDLDKNHKTDVFEFPEYAGSGMSIGSGNWSPSGNYLILMEPEGRRQYYCVNLADGTARLFGQTDAYHVGVAWTSDSRRAFCVSNKVGSGDQYQALVLNPETGVAVDCTAEFQKLFAGHAPSVIPLWTTDGKYVIINALGVAGYLVRPDPWEAIPLGQKVAPCFSISESSKGNPWLFWLPIPDRIGVVPTGNDGDSPVKYVSDYSGKHVRPLLEGYPRAISPDGAIGATIENDGHIKIHHLGI